MLEVACGVQECTRVVRKNCHIIWILYNDSDHNFSEINVSKISIV